MRVLDSKRQSLVAACPSFVSCVEQELILDEIGIVRWHVAWPQGSSSSFYRPGCFVLQRLNRLLQSSNHEFVQEFKTRFDVGLEQRFACRHGQAFRRRLRKVRLRTSAMRGPEELYQIAVRQRPSFNVSTSLVNLP